MVAVQDQATTTPAARVLIIDDEPQIRKFIDISVRSQGFRTLLAATGEQGLSLLATQGADLIILDLGLPDRDGLEVLIELRQWSQVPVIVLTVRSDEKQKVDLLDAGANDYVTKPFGIEELMARIRALLRNVHHSGDATPIYDDGVLRVDLAQREVRLRAQTVSLHARNLRYFHCCCGSRDVSSPSHNCCARCGARRTKEDTHYLRILVGKLRNKLGDDASAPEYIITEPGVGLRFLPKERPTA